MQEEERDNDIHGSRKRGMSAGIIGTKNSYFKPISKHTSIFETLEHYDSN